MTENSKSMTLEEKLVQHIKDIGLGALIEDEDAITELTRKAVDAALIQKRLVRDGSYSTKEIDSPVVEAARAIATEALKQIFDVRVKALFDDPATATALNEALASALPGALRDAMQSLLGMALQRTEMNTQANLMNALRQRGIQI